MQADEPAHLRRAHRSRRRRRARRGSARPAELPLLRLLLVARAVLHRRIVRAPQGLPPPDLHTDRTDAAALPSDLDLERQPDRIGSHALHGLVREGAETLRDVRARRRRRAQDARRLPAQGHQGAGRAARRRYGQFADVLRTYVPHALQLRDRPPPGGGGRRPRPAAADRRRADAAGGFLRESPDGRRRAGLIRRRARQRPPRPGGPRLHPQDPPTRQFADGARHCLSPQCFGPQDRERLQLCLQAHAPGRDRRAAARPPLHGLAHLERTDQGARRPFRLRRHVAGHPRLQGQVRPHDERIPRPAPTLTRGRARIRGSEPDCGKATSRC